jgi:hypothetical protein
VRLLRRSHPWVKKILWALAAGLLLVSTALVVWSLWPPRLQHLVLQLSEKNLENIGFTPAQQTALGEYHLAQISLEWPETLRIGETGRITLAVEPQPNTELVRSSQGLAIDARLDLVGLELYPASEARTGLPPGKLLRLYWQVRAAQSGDYPGTAWLYIVFPPTGNAQNSSPTTLPLSAQNLDIKVIALAGLDLSQVRFSGAAGIFVGMLLMLFLIVVIKS